MSIAESDGKQTFSHFRDPVDEFLRSETFWLSSYNNPMNLLSEAFLIEKYKEK